MGKTSRRAGRQQPACGEVTGSGGADGAKEASPCSQAVREDGGAKEGEEDGREGGRTARGTGEERERGREVHGLPRAALATREVPAGDRGSQLRGPALLSLQVTPQTLSIHNPARDLQARER